MTFRTLLEVAKFDSPCYEYRKEEHHRFIQKPGQTTLRILRTSVATTQPKGHRQPGRSSEENDQNDLEMEWEKMSTT